MPMTTQETAAARAAKTEEMERNCAVIEARLRALLGARVVPGGRLHGIIEPGGLNLSVDAHGTHRDRARFLLTLLTVTAAARTRGLTRAQGYAAVDDICGGGPGLRTPEGRYIERHKMLLALLVYRGCRRRGEF